MCRLPVSFGFWSKSWLGDMGLFGNVSVWAPTGTLGQAAIIFKVFDRAVSGSSTLQLIVLSPHTPLEVDVWAWGSIMAEAGMRKTEVKQDDPYSQPLKDKTQNLLHRLNLHWNNTETEKRCNCVGIMCILECVWDRLYPICETRMWAEEMGNWYLMKMKV